MKYCRKPLFMAMVMILFLTAGMFLGITTRQQLILILLYLFFFLVLFVKKYALKQTEKGGTK